MSRTVTPSNPLSANKTIEALISFWRPSGCSRSTASATCSFLQDLARQDVTLNLAGAAVNRDRAVVEIPSHRHKRVYIARRTDVCARLEQRAVEGRCVQSDSLQRELIDALDHLAPAQLEQRGRRSGGSALR